jgi:hypothetical protein
MSPYWTLVAVTIVGWSAAALGWLKWLHEIREKRKAEQALHQIKRRGEAPYLEPSATFFNGINFIFEKDEPRLWQADSPNVLGFRRDEVDSNLPPEQPIIFVVNNAGETARGVIVKLDGEQIALKREADFNNSQGLFYLEYPYKPEKHGMEQAITIQFETRSGVQDTHRYVTKHGFRILRRADPGLPR